MELIRAAGRSNWDDWQMFGAVDWLSWEKIHKSLFKTRNMTWSVVFYKSFIFEEKTPSFLKLLLQKEMYPYVAHYLVWTKTKFMWALKERKLTWDCSSWANEAARLSSYLCYSKSVTKACALCVCVIPWTSSFLPERHRFLHKNVPNIRPIPIKWYATYYWICSSQPHQSLTLPTC